MEAVNRGDVDGLDIATRQFLWLGIALFGDASSVTIVGVGNPNANS
jgi:hypothetical protein